MQKEKPPNAVNAGANPILKQDYSRYVEIQTPQAFHSRMYDTLERLGIEKHTPHDTWDTFSTLADKYKMDKTYLKRLIGHSLSKDITEDKYISPALEDLRTELCKIQFP